MKLYLAGVISTAPINGNICARLEPDELIARTTPRWYLESYHYMNSKKHVERVKEEGVKVFLDSGAFSAFTLGEVIDIHKYCDFISTHQDIIHVASVLDGIGNPQLTMDNQMIMESQLPKNLHPLPCFHYGEELYPDGLAMLEYYIANYEYITLGGMVPVSTPQLHKWLDRLWGQYLTDDKGFAKIKVHGFGMTSLPLMLKYPWYSVDSSSWVQQGKVGIAVVDMGGERPEIIQMSSTSASLKTLNKHYNTLSDHDKIHLRDKFAEDGFEPVRMGEVYISRWTYNMLTYYRMGERTGDHPFIDDKQYLGLF